MHAQNWKSTIDAASQFFGSLIDTEIEGLTGDVPPRGPTTAEQVASFERELGERLPFSYRDFLLNANGWPSFYFMVDIFGLPELCGELNGHIGRSVFESYDAEEVFEDCGLQARDLLPIAGGPCSTLVVIVRSGRPTAGETIEFDGGESGRYADFAAYFNHTIDQHRRYLERNHAVTNPPSR
jgi:hypothetical protein